jgi:CheY-like chemotaxis protein/HPt (histidine-containing phosphotransfer) domain-containing protein
MVADNNGPAHGFQAVVTKPVKIGDLNAALHQAIHGVCAEPLKSDLSAGGAPAAAQRSGRILVTDDYPTNQQVALMHLTAAGFDVDLADNGQQAVDAVAEKSYDLILMDIQMPVLNGFDATSKIREVEAASGRNGRTPIIALTASALKGDEEKCLSAGMDGYLSKPIRRRQLIQAVDRWIGLQNSLETPPMPKEPEKIAEASTEGDGTIMDIATALEEFGDAKTVRTIARQLIENADGQLERIQASIENEDREAIRKEAHAIKGGAATMEAPGLSKAAFRLEQLSTNGSMKELKVGFDRLKSQIYRFRDFVSQWEGV